MGNHTRHAYYQGKDQRGDQGYHHTLISTVAPEERKLKLLHPLRIGKTFADCRANYPLEALVV